MNTITVEPMPAPIRVLLIDDHPTMLWGLERLIESESTGLKVVGTAGNSTEALKLAVSAQPDVVVLDLALGPENGIDLIAPLLECSHARIVILTGLTEISVRDRAVLLGARGVVGKDEPAANILQAIKKVHAGELWLDRAATSRLFVQLSRATTGDAKSDPQTRIASLTKREREVVGLLTGDPGLSVKRLAQKHGLSEKTVRNHLTAIYNKLGVNSRLGLHMYAAAHRLGATAVE
jgi:two-component system, NarL family, nitrate/nitrite response regulator NarL